MQHAITHLSFADWVIFIFDHPAEGPEWYWGDAPFWNAPAALTAEYVTRLLAVPALKGFTAPELNMGLNYIISPGLGEHMFCLDDPTVPLFRYTSSSGIKNCFRTAAQ